MPDTLGHFRAPEVCRIAGVSYRQLDYWCRTRLVSPSVGASGSGSARLFTRGDVLAVMAVQTLLETGVSLQGVRRAAEFLGGLSEADLSRVTVLSDGERLWACRDAAEVGELLARGGGWFALSTAALSARLDEALAAGARRG